MPGVSCSIHTGTSESESNGRKNRLSFSWIWKPHWRQSSTCAREPGDSSMPRGPARASWCRRSGTGTLLRGEAAQRGLELLKSFEELRMAGAILQHHFVGRAREEFQVRTL